MSIADKHRRRWSRFPMVGCVACRLDGRINTQTQVHHLNLGGRAGQKRRGHDDTIPLCAWHHQGESERGSTWATEHWGPSLAKQSKAFRQRYGNDDQLLMLTNRLLTESDRL